MNDANRSDAVRAARQQQHTGNHDPANRRGAAEVSVESAGPTLVVTPDDAYEAGRNPEAYADALAAKLKPYGVHVRLEAGLAGHGALIGVADPKLEVDIRHAIAIVNSETESARR